MKDDFDDIEILDLSKKKRIPSDETEVLDPVVVKKSINKEVLNRSGSEYAKKVELPSRTSLREQEEKKETKKVVKKEEEKPEKKSKKGKNKKEKKPAKLWEKIFWAISIAFILGCCIFYGKRLIHYYKIYNPKKDGESVALLSDRITINSEIVYEGNGLYKPDANYVYKGEVDKNYIKYNNLLWRIIKINRDGTMVVVLDEYLTMLPWNKESTNYKESDIHKYLNNEFLNNLDKSMLVKTSFCEDSVESLSEISCEKTNSDFYVALLDISTFLNTIVDKKTYLVEDEEIYWLSNYSSEKVWHTNGSSVSMSDANTFYEVRPVIKLKSTIPYISGNGSKEDPYLTEKETKLALGSKVKLGNDTWVVYDTTNGTRLMLEKALDKTYRYDLDKLTYDKDSKSSLAEYLNTEYLESLSYKDYLAEDEWVTGGYSTTFEDLKKNKAKATVGIPSLLDYQYDNSVTGYFTTTSQEEYILVYDNPIHASKVTISRGIRPCIRLTDDAVKKLKLNDGIYTMGD